jgi:hypothetical protein
MGDPLPDCARPSFFRSEPFDWVSCEYQSAEIDAILSGIQILWEVLPKVSTEMSQFESCLITACLFTLKRNAT